MRIIKKAKWEVRLMDVKWYRWFLYMYGYHIFYRKTEHGITYVSFKTSGYIDNHGLADELLARGYTEEFV